MDSGEEHATPLPDVPDWTDKEKLAGEKELLGFRGTGHPLDDYVEKVSELASHDSTNLEGLAKNTEVTICGVLTGITRKRNRDGKPWCVMALEDRTGERGSVVLRHQLRAAGGADLGRHGGNGARTAWP